MIPGQASVSYDLRGSQNKNTDFPRCQPSGQGKKLEPYGWVATANVPPAEGSTDSYDRLQKQAKAEEKKFMELGFEDLLEKGLATQ